MIEKKQSSRCIVAKKADKHSSREGREADYQIRRLAVKFSVLNKSSFSFSSGPNLEAFSCEMQFSAK